MSILINEHTQILVQGITGFQASMDSKFGLKFGAKIVCGVTPGKKGHIVHGIPVYNTVKSALSEHQINATTIYVPAKMVRAAAMEAIDANIPLLVIVTEGIARHDLNLILAKARDKNIRVIGPNTNGIISPGKTRLGGIGGENPQVLFRTGTIGVISRSGGMSAEISLSLHKAGLGISTCVSIGGESIVGTTIKEYVELFNDDPETEAIVIYGEPGGIYEEEAAEYIKSRVVKKPVIAYIAGFFQEKFPKGVSFGHTAALISEGGGSPSFKKKCLQEAGVSVAATLEEIPKLAKRRLGF